MKWSLPGQGKRCRAMIEGFERVVTVHPAYLNDFVIRASLRFVATALWGANDEVRNGVLRHLPSLTQEYLRYEIEAYEGRPDEGVVETQTRMMELLQDDEESSEFFLESSITPQRYGPTIILKGNDYDDVVEYVLDVGAKIHSQGLAGIVPDVPNCPIAFLRLGLELLLLNLPWDDINGILWGYIRSFRMKNGRLDVMGRWYPNSDEFEGQDRLLNFCLVTCSVLQLQAHPVVIQRALRSFTSGDYERLREGRNLESKTDE